MFGGIFPASPVEWAGADWEIFGQQGTWDPAKETWEKLILKTNKRKIVEV